MKPRKWLCLTLVAMGVVFAAAADASARVREYFIAAEDVDWQYAPSEFNLVHVKDAPAPCAILEPFCQPDDTPDNTSPVPGPGCSFPKVRYIQYTDGTFKNRVAQPIWLGVLGPIIRAEVGDTVIVHFRNNAFQAGGSYGMHPHGLRYTKDHEGAFYSGVNSGQCPGAGTQIAPGSSFDYVWTADTESGPGIGEVSSKVWWYHSHVDEPTETNLGLLGPIVVTRRGLARPDGSPRDVDKEFVAAFFVFDEMGGLENGLMHAINGRIFGNLTGFVMNKGDRVRWHLLGMGNEIDLHTPHWHGKTVRVGSLAAGRRTDVIELLPASMVTADMNADNPGEWLFHCHVADHLNAGMVTTYCIQGDGFRCPAPPAELAPCPDCPQFPAP